MFQPNLLIFGLFSFIATCESVKWDKSRVDVRFGDSFNITCQAQAGNFFDVIRISLTTNHGMKYTITDGHDNKAPFSKMERPKVVYSVDDENVVRITLMYNGIRGEDSGTLSCFKLNSPGTTADVLIHVHVPIQSVRWSNDPSTCVRKPSDSETTLHMRQSDECSMTCIVIMEGSIYPPRVQILLDGEDDITRFFTETEETKILPSEDGYERLLSTSTMVYSSLNPNHEFNGHNITCVAGADHNNNNINTADNNINNNGGVDNNTDELPVLSFEPVSTTALLIVEFGPLLTCDMYEYRVSLHSNIFISCSVSSNPRSSIKWSSLGQQSSSTLPEPRVQLNEKQMDHHTWQIELSITDIEESHITEYYLSASNSILTEEVTIALHPLTPLKTPEKSGIMSSYEKLVSNFAANEKAMGKSGSSYSALSTLFLLILSIVFCIVLH